MAFQIYIKTEKTLQQLSTEMRDLLSLPSFKLDAFAGEPYCQFDILGMLILIQQVDMEEREPELQDYPYCFDLQMSFIEHEIDTDSIEYQLQPYYAQLIAFRLGLPAACYEKKSVGQHWQIRYSVYVKNSAWDGSILYGEPGWVPAVLTTPLGPWRTMRSLFTQE